MALLSVDMGYRYIKVATFKSNLPCDKNGSSETVMVFENIINFSEGGDVSIGRVKPDDFNKNTDSNKERRIVAGINRPDDKSFVKFNNSRISHTEVIAFVLKEIKRIAENRFEKTFNDLVLTYSDSTDRNSNSLWKRCAFNAGFKRVELVDSIMAGISTSIESINKEELIIACDFGYESCRFGLFKVNSFGKPVLLKRSMDKSLGSRRFIEKVFEYLLDKIKEQTGVNVGNDPFVVKSLTIEAERIISTLSNKVSYRVEIPFIYADEKGPIHLEMNINRYKLNLLYMDILKRFVDKVRLMIVSSGISVNGIKRMLIFGAGANIPGITDVVKKELNIYPFTGSNPQLHSVVGALYYFLNKKEQKRSGAKVIYLNMNKKYYGVEIENRDIVVLIPAGTVIPARGEAFFTTVKDYQESVLVKVYSGDEGIIGSEKLIGALKLKGIKRGKKGEPTVRVKFEIIERGHLKVKVEDIDTKATKSTVIDIENGKERLIKDGRKNYSYNLRGLTNKKHVNFKEVSGMKVKVAVS